MKRLRALAPAKLNLCLFLGETRADGRHELVTVFESISLSDELSLSVLADGGDQVVCPGVEGPNLVAAALAGLRAAGWAGPPVRIEIAKRIPVAAGLGGGSADAAASLRLASELEPVPEAVMAELAAALGADVAGQLAPGVSVGTAAGEVVRPSPPQGRHAFLILPAPVALSTAEVYREADRMGLPRPKGDLDRLALRLDGALTAGGMLPVDLLVNDLEPAARALYPPIEEVLGEARRGGADHAMLCGSGPTVAGIFWGDEAEARAAAAAAALSGRRPSACSAVPAQESLGSPQFA
jgi:4-diphosphocytidyl-2-C-methyl-D-erythritol kinase